MPTLNTRFYFWTCILISQLVLNGLCVRALATQNLSFAQSLLTRGAVCLLVVIFFAKINNLSLKPKRPLTQVTRALVAGLALTLFTVSYDYLTASAVAVLSNVDVPMLIVLGPLVGVRANWKMRGLAILSILFLIWYVAGLEIQLHLSYGLLSLMGGTLLLCFGYLFIKKSMAEENEAVTILTPSLAILFYGLLQISAVPETAAVHWSPSMILMAVLSGASMFGAYYATMRLYEQTDLATAEFPTLLSSIVIQPFEAIFMDAPMRLSYVLSSVGFVVAIYFLLKIQNRQADHA